MSSATDRFKNRIRPVVASRTDDVASSMQAAAPEPTLPKALEAKYPSISEAGTGDLGLQKLRDELKALPKVGNFQLRFEEHYKAQIKEAADHGDITPETLLQGLWEVAQSRPGLIEDAIAEAKAHHKRRERASELKVAITRATKVLEKIQPLL